MKSLKRGNRALEDSNNRDQIRQLKIRGVTHPNAIARFLNRSPQYVKSQLSVIRKEDVELLSGSDKEEARALARARLEKELSIHGEIESRLFNKTIIEESDPDDPNKPIDPNYVNPRTLKGLLETGEHVRLLLNDITELDDLKNNKRDSDKPGDSNVNQGVVINVNGEGFALDKVKDLLYQLMPPSEKPPEIEEKPRDYSPLVLDVEVEKKEENEE